MLVGQALGLLGGLLLGLGVFAPAVRVPVLGGLSYFNNGHGDGLILLAIAFVCIVLSALGRLRAAGGLGGFSLGIVAVLLIRLEHVITTLQTTVTTDLRDNPFRGLGEAFAQGVQVDWGFGAMIGGALLIATAPLLAASASHVVRPAALVPSAGVVLGVLASLGLGPATDLSGLPDRAPRAGNAPGVVGPPRPDVLPVLLNREIPLRYPPALYARKVQGNVVLRIFIDSIGHLRPESTVVAEPSGEPAFDSAAIAGARELRFTPAQLHGAPIAVSILFPIRFRHPEGAPMPEDSALHQH